MTKSPRAVARPRMSTAIRTPDPRGLLGEAFLTALHEDFRQHGGTAIQELRQQNPAAYVKMVDALLPKDAAVPTQEPVLTDAELIQRIRQLDALLKPLLASEDAQGCGGAA